MTNQWKCKKQNIKKKNTTEIPNGVSVFFLYMLANNGMKKLYNGYADRLQKLWERIVMDYNGNDFTSNYINREEI